MQAESSARRFDVKMRAIPALKNVERFTIFRVILVAPPVTLKSQISEYTHKIRYKRSLGTNIFSIKLNSNAKSSENIFGNLMPYYLI